METMAANTFRVLMAFLLSIQTAHRVCCEAQTTSETAPALYREDNTRYKVLQANVTLLKLLLEPDKDNITKSEIFDMLHSRDQDYANTDLPSFPEDQEVYKAEVLDSNPNMQAEIIQGADEVVERDAKSRMWDGPEREHTLRMRGGPYRGAMAGIMVAVTCAVVLVAYVGLIAWKRADMIRNGQRHELLRNEENPADTRIEM